MLLIIFVADFTSLQALKLENILVIFPLVWILLTIPSKIEHKSQMYTNNVKVTT